MIGRKNALYVMYSVNVTRRILEDAEHWYCFECIDNKPKSGIFFIITIINRF